jgi:hypothetical protein
MKFLGSLRNVVASTLATVATLSSIATVPPIAPEAKAQCGGGCGWTQNSYEWENFNGEEECSYYYQTTNYYYCGEFEYDNTTFLYNDCP